VYKFNSKITG